MMHNAAAPVASRPGRDFNMMVSPFKIGRQCFVESIPLAITVIAVPGMDLSNSRLASATHPLG